MHDPNAAIGGSYAFTWRRFAALVPKRDYDEVHRHLRRRSKRERLKMGEAAAAAALDAMRNGIATEGAAPELRVRHRAHVRVRLHPGTEPTTHRSANSGTRH